MQWEVKTNGFSFNKYKKTYLNSLYKKLGIENLGTFSNPA